MPDTAVMRSANAKLLHKGGENFRISHFVPVRDVDGIGLAAAISIAAIPARKLRLSIPICWRIEVKLRSQGWFSGPEYYAFARRAWLRSEGHSHAIFDGRPIVGIANFLE
jgi:hypothetical protein